MIREEKTVENSFSSLQDKENMKNADDHGENRRNVRDATSAIQYLLHLPPIDSIAKELEDLGIPKFEQTNMIALQARLYGKAMGGDLKSYETLMKMGGYEAPSGRTSGQEEKIPTSGANEPEDVFIYLPKIEEEPLKSGNSIESDQPKTGG